MNVFLKIRIFSNGGKDIYKEKYLLKIYRKNDFVAI